MRTAVSATKPAAASAETPSGERTYVGLGHQIWAGHSPALQVLYACVQWSIEPSKNPMYVSKPRPTGVSSQ